MPRFDVRDYARRGAEARARELTEELESIYRAFPDLRGSASGGARRSPANTGALSGPATSRRRPRMSAAQRKAVGERMRRYWAERRKAAAAAKK